MDRFDDHGPFPERRNISRRSVYALGRARRLGTESFDTFAVTTWNVSHSGIQVQCPPDIGERLTIGEELALRFGEDPATAIDVTGRLAWREPWVPERGLLTPRRDNQPDRFRLGIAVDIADPGLLDRFFGRC